jgi:anti-anti-sigma factor
VLLHRLNLPLNIHRFNTDIKKNTFDTSKLIRKIRTQSHGSKAKSYDRRATKKDWILKLMGNLRFFYLDDPPLTPINLLVGVLNCFKTSWHLMKLLESGCGWMMELTVNIEKQNSILLLKIKGILDISTSNVIEQHLENVHDIKTLVLDFANLEFIDSTGIGAIINAVYLAQEKNFKLKMQGVDELTNEVFETVGLYQILEALQGEVA